ncbi:UNVERIFIED_CONTAM: hypothetical protein FKN15_032466 [Acipenser sinensis]
MERRASKSITALANGQLTLECQSDTDPPPAIQWFKDDIALQWFKDDIALQVSEDVRQASMKEPKKMNEREEAVRNISARFLLAD